MPQPSNSPELINTQLPGLTTHSWFQTKSLSIWEGQDHPNRRVSRYLPIHTALSFFDSGWPPSSISEVRSLVAGKLPYKNTDITTYTFIPYTISHQDTVLVTRYRDILTKEEPKTKLFDKGNSEEKDTMTEVSTVAIDAAKPITPL